MSQIYLAQITAGIDGTGDTKQLLFSSGTGYNNPAAPGFHDPSIIQAALMRRDVFEDGQTFGESRVSFGQLQLANNDGHLDYLFQYGYGRTATLLIGEETDAPSAFITFLTGTVQQPTTSDLQTLSFLFQDRQAELALPMQVATFGGTNSGATGIDGTPNDIGGKTMPRTFGVAPNVTPAPLNTAALIYGVNFDRSGSTKAVSSFDGVYDSGIALMLDTSVGTGGDCSTLAGLQSAVIAPGKYATCVAAGLFRLSSSPAGSVTCDVTEGAATTDRHVAGLINRILLDAGVASGNISAADIAALEAAAPYVAGFYFAVGDSTVYKDALDLIAGSAGAWYSPDRLNVYRVNQIKTPSGSPAITLKRFEQGIAAAIGDCDIQTIQRSTSTDPGLGIPAWQINLNWGRSWTVQTAGELAGGASDARRAYVQQEYRTVTSQDATVQAQFPLAAVMNFDSVLVNQADAQAESARRLAIYKVLRAVFNVQINITPAIAATIDLGTVVQLMVPRFGLDNGVLFLVTGLQYDAEKNQLNLTVWG